MTAGSLPPYTQLNSIANHKRSNLADAARAAFADIALVQDRAHSSRNKRLNKEEWSPKGQHHKVGVEAVEDRAIMRTVLATVFAEAADRPTVSDEAWVYLAVDNMLGISVHDRTGRDSVDKLSKAKILDAYEKGVVQLRKDDDSENARPANTGVSTPEARPSRLTKDAFITALKSPHADGAPLQVRHAGLANASPRTPNGIRSSVWDF